jgi:hypothetical protein
VPLRCAPVGRRWNRLDCHERRSTGRHRMRDQRCRDQRQREQPEHEDFRFHWIFCFPRRGSPNIAFSPFSQPRRQRRRFLEVEARVRLHLVLAPLQTARRTPARRLPTQHATCDCQRNGDAAHEAAFCCRLDAVDVTERIPRRASMASSWRASDSQVSAMESVRRR